MQIVAGRANELHVGALFDMAHFRYRIFVERLGWRLQTHGRLELDQFDRPDTVYVIARDREGNVVGVARLLSTHRPYLLAEVFPQLLGKASRPHSQDVWELSRFAALDLAAAVPASATPFDTSLALILLREAMKVAAQNGAKELVSVSPLGIERILRRGDVRFERMAPPLEISGERLFACRIVLEDMASVSRGASDGSSGGPPPLPWRRRAAAVLRRRVGHAAGH
jgi:N-acyl-L-homoserine lactone synthetase